VSIFFRLFTVAVCLCMPLTGMKQRLLLLWVATTVVTGEDPGPSQNGTCNATGHLEPIAELCSDTNFMGRWLGQNLGCADDFVIKTLKKAEGCPEGGSTEINNVYCETDEYERKVQIHPHWPHTTDTIYPCWYFFQKYPKANWIVFNAISNVDNSSVLYKLHLFGIKERERIPPPACTNDLHIKRKPDRGKSGLHHQEGGSNFITTESAAAYRDRWLQILKKHSKEHRSYPKGRHSQRLASRRGMNNSIQIGIFNRRGSRQIINPELVYKAFIEHLPCAHISTLFDTKALPSFLDVCQWVNHMDIIVAPHGAQLTNLVCAAPCTVLVEVYPSMYFFPGFFGPMANALGLETFEVYPGKDGYAESDPCLKNEGHCGRQARLFKVEMPHEFTKLPPFLFKARQQCCAQKQCWI